MNIPLGALLSAAASPLAKKVLSGLGMGVISFAAVATALNSAIGAAQASYNGMPSYVLGLLGLAGAGTGLGMIAGALVFRATLSAMPKLGVLKK